jgi:hypothetical protein
VAELRVEGEELVVELSPIEKLEAVHGDVRVPASAVVSLDVLDDALGAVHGMKAVYNGVPGYMAVGTFHGVNRQFAVVHHDHRRGVRVNLDGAHFDEIVVSCDDPERVVAELGLPR